MTSAECSLVRDLGSQRSGPQRQRFPHSCRPLRTTFHPKYCLLGNSFDLTIHQLMAEVLVEGNRNATQASPLLGKPAGRTAGEVRQRSMLSEREDEYCKKLQQQVIALLSDLCRLRSDIAPLRRLLTAAKSLMLAHRALSRQLMTCAQSEQSSVFLACVCDAYVLYLSLPCPQVTTPAFEGATLQYSVHRSAVLQSHSQRQFNLSPMQSEIATLVREHPQVTQRFRAVGGSLPEFIRIMMTMPVQQPQYYLTNAERLLGIA